jgi:hypothetical protein
MSVGEETSNGFHESREEIVKDAMEQAAEPQEHAADVLSAGVEFVPRPGPVRSFTNCRDPRDVLGLLKRTAENWAT